MRILDDKFHIENDQIVKTSSGEIVPIEEPLFLVRGRDYLAISVIEHYKRLCELDGCNDYQLSLFDPLISRFKAFSERFPKMMKQPGITRGMPFDPSKKYE